MQLVAIDLLQDVSARRSLSTAYRIRSEVREMAIYNVYKVIYDEYKNAQVTNWK